MCKRWHCVQSIFWRFNWKILHLANFCPQPVAVMVVTNIRYARPKSYFFLLSLPLVFYSPIPTKSCFWNPKTLLKVSVGVYRGWCTRNVCSFSASFSRWPPYLRFHYENITFNKRLLFSCWPRLLNTYHNLKSHWTCFTWEHCTLNPVNTHILVFWMIWN